MKALKLQTVLTIFTLALALNLSAGNALANTHKNIFNACFFMAMPADDANLVLTPIQNDGDINLHISFNGNEGATGAVKLYNASNQLVTEFTVTLVAAPGYSNFNLNEYVPGTYLIELTTSAGVHISHFTL